MRPRAITAIAVMQLAYTLLMTALAVVCVNWARLAATRPNGQSYARGLVIGAAFLAGVGVLDAISTVGLFRTRRWAWILALTTDVLVIALVLWDVLIDHDRDPDNWVVLPLFGVPILLLLLPGVRRSFFRKATPPAATLGPLSC